MWREKTRQSGIDSAGLTSPMRCARCGAGLEANSLGGLCPVCLLDSAWPDDGRDEPADFRYDLIEEIARGGMGVVYRAVQHGSQRQVAVKMILAEQAATPGMMDRFRAEAEAVASLDHPHILPIYEIGETEGRPFYSMKFADGGTLRERAAQFAEPREAARLIAAIARAVHHAHQRGILHRDLKPGNVLLDGVDRRAFVSDFGLAKWMGRESRLTLAQSALGTPHYIAPEQAAGISTKLTPAADVYSLGAMLYELLTGRPPFAGDTALETLRLAREMPTPPPRKFKPSVPRDLEVICLKCLAKEPAARYSSAVALAEDLERWLEGHTIVARPATAAERAWRWTNRNRALAGLSAALAVALVVVILTLSKSAPPMIRGAPVKSIAVLPFENLSGDAENAYFTQGIQDEIVTRLGKIGDLKVISRTSTERFESSPQNLRAISEQLGVANLLKGTVQKSGDQVRVRVQLIEASSGAHLWAEGYDRKLTDIFRVESDIAQAIAGTLQAKLSGAETQAIARRPTENPAAHQLYLKGRFFWNKTTESDLRKAIDYFTQAIAADPNYALAYVGVAESNLVLPFIAGGHPQDCYPTAKASAQRALEIDPALAEAHIALAETLRVYDFDTGKANTEFQKGIELDPNYAVGHWRYSWLLQSVGRGDEALAEMRRAVELDPLSLIINTDLGYLHTVSGRYDQAIEQLHRTLEIDPNFYYAHGNLGEALEFKGSLNEALEEYAKTRALTDDPFGLALLAHIHAALGNTGEARKILDQLHEFAKKRYVQSYTFAVANLGLGEREEALRLLEESYRDRAGGDISFIRIDPFLAPLRGEPRFEALADKIAPRFVGDAPATSEKSIAVLPFIDLSEAKDQEYFCDGISEQILDSLARVEGLQVAARTSSFSLKGSQLGAKEIAAKLGVRHLLEGSLRRDGNRIRVTAQLIDARNGFHIWSETYERELQGVFAVQDEITQAITTALKLKLAGGRTRTVNPEAYDLYLQGMFFSSKSTEEGLRKSLDFFQKSLEKDPGFAKSWSGTARAWNWLADAYVRPLDAFPQMKAAAEKALALDPNDAEAHIWLAEAKRILDWDLKGFRDELERALTLDPNSATAHTFLGLYEATHGNRPTALRQIRESVRLDPLSPNVSHFAAMGYMCMGDLDEAMAEGRRTLELDPNYIYESPILANIYREKGMLPEAIALFKTAEQMTGRPQSGLAVLYATTGRQAEAREILDELEKIAATKYMAAEDIAAVYVALGEKEEAYKWLERAWTDHGGAIHAVPIRPVFRPLHSDARFQEMVRRLGLDPALILKPGK
jgi:TolB-like protein/Tfp pilus assembly protein PilF/predicted Ser/Thr protein kinase